MAKKKLTKKESAMDAAFAHFKNLPKTDWRPEGEGWFSLEEYMERMESNGMLRSIDVHRNHLNTLVKSQVYEKFKAGPGNQVWFRKL